MDVISYLKGYFMALLHAFGVIFCSAVYPSSWFSWRPTSMAKLAQAERKILQAFLRKTTYDTKYVTLPNTHHRLWTLTVDHKDNEVNNKKVPLVMVHGMGGGIGLWAQNLGPLSENRPLYAFDVLGFGRSSRPQFSSKPEKTEQQFVESIEEWRKEMDIKEMILLGHSLGAYISGAYSLKYPDRVKHLVLVDAWGFPEKPPEDQQRPIPMWIKVIATIIKPFNPLAVLRVAGPFGPGLVRRFRPDLQDKFADTLDDDTIFDYIYHCNAQSPSGETAFKNLNTSFGWAKNPMIHRLPDLKKEVPVTLVYGSKSWVDSNTGYHIKYLRNESFVEVAVVRGAGHHVYADKPNPFNKLIQRVCEAVDNNTNPKPLKFRESFKASSDSSTHMSKTISESKSSKNLVTEETLDDEEIETVPAQVL
ncbi:(Lyso)-N-acylphosphatidylethanolamine lipase-like isoform X1 [Saccostrea cucullata]|uniref:(Lyso)-N-acylphosphatidylethanolamine lipase-like isoform X1 n=1 Tax=Saccostrea cuccullata TaxID=36930 RepID=UPI002ED1DD52